MLTRNITPYACMLVLLAACSKQNTPPVSESAQAGGSNSSLRWHWIVQNTGQETVFGLIKEQGANQTIQSGIEENQNDMNTAGVNLTRRSIALSEATESNTIDTYLEDGYNVQIIVNWNGGVNGTRGFPSGGDLEFLKSRAAAFFEYYAPYKKQIPCVAIENEWDWEVVHGANLQDYLAELRVMTTIGHQYGFKITDGGITSTALQRWTYSQLDGDAQVQWDENYWVGLNAGYDYNDLIDIVNSYAAGVQNIDIDHSNVHWTNATTCGNGFATATQIFMEACNKKSVVCNEFSIRTDSSSLFDSTVNEITGNAEFAIAYSGTNDGPSIKLSDEMLRML